ncbi:hypothetical protein Bca52824_026352 [Brassica carinata]|uniref:Uncharacterized protein n=1 Tax=Brassica carinata TaxID=52824 RepID=A0A8X7SGH0_BRACI|nr:hypothetical protein Bca52824_026352 [Brassica carinata]
MRDRRWNPGIDGFRRERLVDLNEGQMGKDKIRKSKQERGSRWIKIRDIIRWRIRKEIWGKSLGSGEWIGFLIIINSEALEIEEPAIGEFGREGERGGRP